MPNLAEPSGKQRIQSIDILRGVIMLIMALDHSRDFFHLAGPNSNPTDMATTTSFFFFTRWITHFCAPIFLFLSGVSAYLAGLRRTNSELSLFLIKRGVWLVFAELVILTFAFTFNPLYNLFILQVLWAIGWSMIVLGLVVRAPLAVIGVIGGLIVFGHDIFDYVDLPKTGAGATLLQLLLTSKTVLMQLDSKHFVFDLYAILPWTGIMLLGYVFGSLYKPSFDAEKRKKILLYTGLAVLAFFVLLRYFNIYGDPAPWSVQRDGLFTFLSFINVSKYPPSLFYTCMTVGTGLVILSLIENVQNQATRVFTIYGSVPFFYYILHFYLIHIITVILFFATGFTTKQIVDPQSPFLFRPSNFGFDLGTVYLLWLLVIGILYFPCRWFSKYKKTHSQWWLSYL